MPQVLTKIIRSKYWQIPSVFILWLFLPILANAQSIIEPRITKPSLWDVFGFGRQTFLASVREFFSYGSILKTLSTANFILTFSFVIFLFLFIWMISKIFSYSKQEYSLFQKIKLIPWAVNDPIGYFQKHCLRNDTGTYTCSFTDHKRYQRHSKNYFSVALTSLLVKVIVILIIFAMEGGYMQAFAGRTGDNYSIFIDTQSGGGGRSVSTGNYALSGTIGESLAATNVSSANYRLNSGFSGITSEPTVGLTVNQNLVSMGLISYLSTSYATSTFSSYYSGDQGFDIYASGTFADSQGDVIDAIGPTAVSPQVGVEQFGLNLTANSLPANFGAAPVGGSAVARTAYNQPNKYAFESGTSIATSSSRSALTDFTASFIVNSSRTSPAGSYVLNLTLSIVPHF